MNANFRRGAESQRKERLGFVILQHIHTLTMDAAGSLSPDHIAANLALSKEETREILEMLVVQGFVQWDGDSGAALVTKEGATYLLQLAGRRRSVRFRGGVWRPPAQAMRPASSTAADGPQTTTSEPNTSEGQSVEAADSPPRNSESASPSSVSERHQTEQDPAAEEGSGAAGSLEQPPPPTTS